MLLLLVTQCDCTCRQSVVCERLELGHAGLGHAVLGHVLLGLVEIAALPLVTTLHNHRPRQLGCDGHSVWVGRESW